MARIPEWRRPLHACDAMRLLHDRYAVRGDCGCDLVTGESLPLAELQRDERPIPTAWPDADPLGPLAELFDQGREASPRWVVAQARGAQSHMLQRHVAALARTHGFVAIAVSTFHRLHLLIEADLRDRTLLLVGGVGVGLDAARDALLAAASWSPRPHLLLTFAAPERRSLASVVREARAVYGARVPRPLPVTVAAGVEPHLQRALKAREFVRAGRHAAAERLLRDVAGALERRRAFEPATRVIEMLVAVLMDRGRLDSADAACREALRVAGLAASESDARRARALEASVRIEQARLTEAEGLLRALLVTSGEVAMPPLALAALSRCLCL